MRNLEVWYTQFEIESLLPDLRARVEHRDATPARQARRKGASARQHAGLRQARREGRRCAQDRLRPPLIVRLDDFESVAERDRARADLERMLREYGARSSTTPQAAGAVPARRRRPQGRRGRERRDRRLDRAAPRPQRQATSSSCRSRRRSDRCSRSSSAPSVYANAGERVVAGQRIMQAASDIFLGWFTVAESIAGIARLLRPSAPRLEGVGRSRGDERARAVRLRPVVRGDAGPRPRPLRRPDRDRLVPRRRRRVRPGATRLLARLRGAERAGLRRPRRSRPSRGACRPSGISDRYSPGVPFGLGVMGIVDPRGRPHAALRRQGRAVGSAAARLERPRGEGRGRRDGPARHPRSEGRAEARSRRHRSYRPRCRPASAGEAEASPPPQRSCREERR